MKKLLCLLTALALMLSAVPVLANTQADWDAACTLIVEADAWVYHLHTDEAEGVAPVTQLPAGTHVLSHGMYGDWMYVDYMEKGSVRTGAVKALVVHSLLPEASPLPTAVPQYAAAGPAAQPQSMEGTWIERYGSYTCLVYADGEADEVLTSTLTLNEDVDSDKQLALVKAGSASQITMRSKASTKGSAVMKCPVGAIVPVLSIANGWAKIAYGDTEGYVSTSNLQFDIVVDEILGYGVLTMENPESIYSIINIRAKASTSSTRVAEWFPGNEVVVIRRTGDWYEVEAYGTRGYVKTQYVTLVTNE